MPKQKLNTIYRKEGNRFTPNTSETFCRKQQPCRNTNNTSKTFKTKEDNLLQNVQYRPKYAETNNYTETVITKKLQSAECIICRNYNLRKQ